jgi:glycosyltransferase involved in cell wall biosynthesis
VPNGIDCERFTPATDGERAAAITGDPRLRVVFVGRMIAEKGPTS